MIISRHSHQHDQRPKNFKKQTNKKQKKIIWKRKRPENKYYKVIKDKRESKSVSQKAKNYEKKA